MEAHLLLYSVTAFTITFLATPVLIKVLLQWKLFDSPGDHKIHVGFKPSMGGVSVMLGVAFTLLISFPLAEWFLLKYFFIALSIMFITGLRDDILTLSPPSKLIGQVLPIVLLVVFGKTTLNSFYDINSTLWPLWLSWGISVFTLVILTNAYNLIDGLDGLAGSVATIVLLFFGIWFYSIDELYLSILSFAFASATVAFLVYNWQPAKLFMGDTGTLSIGLTIAFLGIQFINKNYALPDLHPGHFLASISTAICVLIIPVFDTTRVIILRLRKLQSPFKADRNHLHHQFVNLGFSHAQTALVIGFINLCFIVLAWILRKQSDVVILPVIIGLCLVINGLLKIAISKRRTSLGE